MTAITCGIKEPDGSPMGAADRLGLTFTLILTSVAYKFVVAASIPALSYQTLLDVYVLICFAWMLIAALENAIFSHLGEAVASFNELWVMLIYLASFGLANIIFWTRISLRLGRQALEAKRKFDDEAARRERATELLKTFKKSQSFAV